MSEIFLHAIWHLFSSNLFFYPFLLWCVARNKLGITLRLRFSLGTNHFQAHLIPQILQHASTHWLVSDIDAEKSSEDFFDFFPRCVFHWKLLRLFLLFHKSSLWMQDFINEWASVIFICLRTFHTLHQWLFWSLLAINKLFLCVACYLIVIVVLLAI